MAYPEDYAVNIHQGLLFKDFANVAAGWKACNLWPCSKRRTRVIEMVKDEFEFTMALCGCPGVMDITRSHVRTECDKLHSML
ncbi:unnamed protein product [Prunus armeniaca]|uniref:Uncharacterized protein n=1 Tax=Prunus armeniaca TaxID=36596 RepID=A0A6J5WLC5_PRUAR|nr:unnamed protein product [Prunus armeniaca]